MSSELIYRGQEAPPVTDGYTPKPPKPWLNVIRPVRYMLREQRLVFLIAGIAVATVIFTLLPSSNPAPYVHGDSVNGRGYDAISGSDFLAETTAHSDRLLYQSRVGLGSFNSGGKIPLGLKQKGLRIVVTGGAGFVGSHLVDRLIARGDSVIVVDNFFTGRKENIMHHFGNPRFELIRHDVVEPLLLEVDQIYHLACPASPVHYKHNPVRIARIFNTYGPRMCIDDGRVVSNFVAQALRKEPMTVYGDGKQTRSFQFVSDLVDGLIRLMEGEHVGPFNLGNPGEFTMLELAKVVQETIDPNARIEFRPNTEDDPHMRKPDISRAKELLGWEPKVPLRKGLPMMVQDFRQRVFGDHKEDAPTTSTT
nr:UDP-glucuronic acid decarboxylase 4 [Ipomoea batatas]GMD68918.1 UDP-glucuronic acid decarboxylase 4 [Ipomoea batatas]GMD72936.1 UDP-glucuronic acid decarboxylase 4 [Ipomoea batatas]